MSRFKSGVEEETLTDLTRNSVHFASERTDKRAIYKKGIDEKVSCYFAPVRLCGMCVSDSQAYLPCTRSHLKKINVPRRHPNRSELW